MATFHFFKIADFRELSKEQTSSENQSTVSYDK